MIADDLAIRLPMSPFLTATLARAADYAAAQSHIEVAVEHLLLALTEDPEATVVLKSSSVDVARLKAEVSDFIGRIEERHDEGGGSGVAVSADLRRILEAAAAAAQQGRRREINGAIVLAAIVGDGKSGAAHMLRSQGLTFEEAIRALQKAAQQQANAASGPPPPRPPQATADDILASARERIQTRAATPRAAAEVPSAALAPQPPSRPAAPRFGGAPPPDAQDQPLSTDGDSYESSPHGAGELASPTRPQPSPRASELSTEPSFSTRPGPPPQAPPSMSPVPRESGVPGAGQQDLHASPPSDAAATPRQPQRRSPSWAPPAPRGAPPQQPGAPSARGRAPPPLPANPGPLQIPGQLPSHLPGAAAGAGVDLARGAPQSRVPWPEAIDPPAAPAPQARAEGAPRSRQAGPRPVISAGQLVHNIPPKMKVGVSLVCEARIGRAEVKAIVDGLQGGGAVVRHEVMVTKAMSVRLRSPDGGFFIEGSSPETQWIENVLGLPAEDFARWRWTITPREKGRKRLQLIVSARTVGGDGLTAETAMPDQVIEIRVRTNYARSLKRWLGWGLAAILGGVLGRFGDVAFGFVKSLLGG